MFSAFGVPFLIFILVLFFCCPLKSKSQVRIVSAGVMMEFRCENWNNAYFVKKKKKNCLNQLLTQQGFTEKHCVLNAVNP